MVATPTVGVRKQILYPEGHHGFSLCPISESFCDPGNFCLLSLPFHPRGMGTCQGGGQECLCSLKNFSPLAEHFHMHCLSCKISGIVLISLKRKLDSGSEMTSLEGTLLQLVRRVRTGTWILGLSDQCPFHSGLCSWALPVHSLTTGRVGCGWCGH